MPVARKMPALYQLVVSKFLAGGTGLAVRRGQGEGPQQVGVGEQLIACSDASLYSGKTDGGRGSIHGDVLQGVGQEEGVAQDQVLKGIEAVRNMQELLH